MTNPIDSLPRHLTLRSDAPPMQVSRLKDGRFHVWKYGESSLMLTGYDYILVRDPLTEFLKKYCFLDAQFYEREVIQLVSGQSWTGYTEIRPTKELTPENIQTENVIESSVWHFNKGELFISPGLSQILAKEEWSNQFEMSFGFDNFAG